MSFAFFGLLAAPALAQPVVPSERDRVQPPSKPEAQQAIQERAHPPENAGGVQNPEPPNRSKLGDEHNKAR